MDMLRYACKKIVRPISTDFIRINDKELPMNAVTDSIRYETVFKQRIWHLV